MIFRINQPYFYYNNYNNYNIIINDKYNALKIHINININFKTIKIIYIYKICNYCTNNLIFMQK